MLKISDIDFNKILGLEKRKLTPYKPTYNALIGLAPSFYKGKSFTQIYKYFESVCEKRIEAFANWIFTAVSFQCNGKAFKGYGLLRRCELNLTIRQMSAHTKLPISTIHRYLKRLKMGGFFLKDKRYKKSSDKRHRNMIFYRVAKVYNDYLKRHQYRMSKIMRLIKDKVTFANGKNGTLKTLSLKNNRNIDQKEIMNGKYNYSVNEFGEYKAIFPNNLIIHENDFKLQGEFYKEVRQVSNQEASCFFGNLLKSLK